MQQEQIIKDTSDKFCGYSGHQINNRKTHMFFSKGVSENLRDQISSFLRFYNVQNLRSYLRVPLFHNKFNNSTLSFVVEKVLSKLYSWDARQLFMVGRSTFAQSILLSIPSYFMQSMMISKGIYVEIERLVRQFIWGSSSGKKKLAMANWNFIFQPWSNRSFGVGHLRDHNTSFMVKLGFHLITNSNALWVRILRSKYRIQDGISEDSSRSRCSYL